VIGAMPETLEQAGLPAARMEKELIEVQSIKDRGPGPHFLTGPIFIEEAAPGDVLEVRIHSLELPFPYGINFFDNEHAGFLAEKVPGQSAKLIEFDRERMIGHFIDGIEIPLRPFFGSMGVAPPKDAGRWNSAPPWIHAGNMDNKEMTAGTTLYIPVYVNGALFEIGDGHAAQGNGEVDGTAIETALSGLLQFVVHKHKKLAWPRAETPTHFLTMGSDKDLTTATRIATREMITYLMEERKLSQADALMLASMAMDLSITQLVDGFVGVHAMLPKSLFIKK
jgi:acetamidase/formamidase